MEYSGSPYFVICVLSFLSPARFAESMIWYRWPTENVSFELGYSSQSYYRRQAEPACNEENGTLLDLNNTKIQNNYEALREFALNLDYQQNYWVASRFSDDCPTVIYIENNLLVDTTKSCTTDMVRVFCSRGSLSDLSSPLSWGVWIPWSACSASCSGGQRIRLRVCDGFNSICPYSLGYVSDVQIGYDIQSEVCNSQACPSWLPWGPWLGCNDTCEEILRTRRRVCSGDYYGSEGCEGPTKEVEACQITEEEQRACDVIDKSRQEELGSEGPAYKQSDARTSAISTGIVAIIFVAIEVSLLLAGDISQCRRHFRICCRNLHLQK